MSHKQFLLILAVWLAVMVLIFATPAQPVEIGLTNSATTCARSELDQAAVAQRLVQLKEMYKQTPDESGRLVLRAEADALMRLARSISMWRVENCRNA